MPPTPGPWIVDTIKTEMTYGGGPDASTGMVTTYIVTAQDGQMIADTSQSDVVLVEEEYHEDGVSAFDAQGRANAALIAAAPDLLDACRFALLALSGAMVNRTVAIETLQAAIAKAKE